MAKKFRDLTAGMSRERLERIEKRVQETLAEMPLHELRAARQLTQETLAETLHMSQANVSKVERRTDMYISTLRKYVEAMGGRLEITAHFDDGSVRIRQFADLAADEPGAADDPPALSA